MITIKTTVKVTNIERIPDRTTYEVRCAVFDWNSHSMHAIGSHACSLEALARV